MQGSPIGFCSQEELSLFFSLERLGFSDVFRELNPDLSALTIFSAGQVRWFQGLSGLFYASLEMQPSVTKCCLVTSRRRRREVHRQAAADATPTTTFDVGAGGSAQGATDWRSWKSKSNCIHSLRECE
jgi:hypothetical protein